MCGTQWKRWYSETIVFKITPDYFKNLLVRTLWNNVSNYKKKPKMLRTKIFAMCFLTLKPTSLFFPTYILKLNCEVVSISKKRPSYQSVKLVLVCNSIRYRTALCVHIQYSYYHWNYFQTQINSWKGGMWKMGTIS